MSERLYPLTDGALWVAEQGQGLPIMLCSGGPGCCDYLAPVAALVDTMTRVFRFEQRGCGRSSSAGPYNLETCLSDLEELRRLLELDRWVIGGHSWGANLALAYALTYPQRAQGLIMLCGTGVQNDRSWHEAYRTAADADLDPQPQYAYPPNMEVNREVMASWRQFIKQPLLLRRLAELTAPALIIDGGADIRPGWPNAQLAALLPRARRVVLDGAGHLLWENHAEQLGHELRQFLTTLEEPV